MDTDQTIREQLNELVRIQQTLLETNQLLTQLVKLNDKPAVDAAFDTETETDKVIESGIEMNGAELADIEYQRKCARTASWTYLTYIHDKLKKHELNAVDNFGFVTLQHYTCQRILRLVKAHKQVFTDEINKRKDSGRSGGGGYID